MTSIAFTGGGTAGHVIPNIALIEGLNKKEFKINYLGSYHGMERGLIESLSINYYPISTGKLRRYFSWKNCTDPFKLLKGVIQAWWILRRIKPDVLFSKGGFVAVPCVLAAWLHRIPVIVHESDLTPGLANKLCFPFAQKICLNFELTQKYLKCDRKAIVTGTPIRKQLFEGASQKAIKRCHFSDDKPCLLVVGGGLGAQAINRVVRQFIGELTQAFNVIHLCGKNKVDNAYAQQAGYYQSEFAHEEMADFYALSDVVISRAGANTVCEVMALAKPHIFIPLSEKASRGDQIQNAEYFSKLGVSTVIRESNLTPELLSAEIERVYTRRDAIQAQIKQLNCVGASEQILQIITRTIQE